MKAVALLLAALIAQPAIAQVHGTLPHSQSGPDNIIYRPPMDPIFAELGNFKSKDFSSQVHVMYSANGSVKHACLVKPTGHLPLDKAFVDWALQLRFKRGKPGETQLPVSLQSDQ